MLFKVAKLLLNLRYRIEVKGLKEIEKKGCSGILFLPNHPALIDPVIIYTLIYKKFTPRPVADNGQANRKGFKKLISKVKPIKIPDPKIAGPEGSWIIKKALETSCNDLKSGKNMIIYPAGKMTFTGVEEIGANSGVSHIVKNVSDLRIVLIRTKGLWGSVFSRAYGKAPDFVSFIPTLIKILILNVIFFIPKREVAVEFVEPEDFPFDADRLEINRYLENFYNKTITPNTFYPYFFFKGKGKRTMPEPVYRETIKDIPDIPEDLMDRVKEKLGELAGVDKKEIKGEYEIYKNPGLDSLGMIDFLMWTKDEFGFNAGFDLNKFRTVNDCFLVAMGLFEK